MVFFRKTDFLCLFLHLRLRLHQEKRKRAEVEPAVLINTSLERNMRIGLSTKTERVEKRKTSGVISSSKTELSNEVKKKEGFEAIDFIRMWRHLTLIVNI